MKNQDRSIEEMLVYLKASVSDDPNFNESLILSTKEALSDFLEELKKRNSESYRTKYFMVEQLIFQQNI